jgi:hypothetical protein
LPFPDAATLAGRRRYAVGLRSVGETVMTEPDRASVAWFCAELPTLRRLLRGPASAQRRAFLEEAVVAARDGESISPFLVRLGIGQNDWLGREYEVSSFRGWSPLPTPVDAAMSAPVSGSYLCPKGTCHRVVTRGAGGELPGCDIHDQALRFVADA